MYALDSITAKLAQLGKDPGEVPRDGAPRACVAAIFREGGSSPDTSSKSGGGAELFFIRRAEREGDPWSGHIAFPGGRVDARDATLLATAMRETSEEVGIDLSRAELLARLPDVPAFTRTKKGTLVVTPFVFALREGATPIINHEVAETLWVPFESLARGEGKGTFKWTWDGRELDLPCIRLARAKANGNANEVATPHLLWGMTYRMLEMLLEAFVIDDSDAPSDASKTGEEEIAGG
jgi:8-oxo-dGTP pyrophosphatase MutT (NUDIX family)